MNLLKKIWTERPLLFIIIIAFLLRFISVIFAKGFGMHDDHFLVIEASQSWADGEDYNYWLPSSKINAQPSGHSLFYVGLHYFIFLFFKFINLSDPQVKMFFIRLLHAFLSLFVVFFGYKITEKLSDKSLARKTALIIAVLWIMPWLSVRNLVEVVCIPFLLAGTWLIMRSDIKKNVIPLLISAGLILGISISIRYQVSIFVFGIILVLLIERKIKNLIFMSLGVIISFSLIQGLTDFIIWKRPFAEFTEYVRYNIHNSNDYITNSWYTYFLFLAGILIPPVSIFLLSGFFCRWKKNLIIFLPSFIFILFHSFFPNKQERFILPVIPFIIILGIIGWREIEERFFVSRKSKNIIRKCWVFFFIINFMLLPFVSTMYSKKARVESMVYLSKYKNMKSLLLEDSNNSSAKMPPLFYLGQWIHVYEVNNIKTADTLQASLKTTPIENYPKFVLFFEDKNIAMRIKNIKNIFPDLKFEKVILPGFIDKILFKLNPVNSNQTIYIFRTI
jgi:hypothetical protein